MLGHELIEQPLVGIYFHSVHFFEVDNKCRVTDDTSIVQMKFYTILPQLWNEIVLTLRNILVCHFDCTRMDLTLSWLINYTIDL